LVVASIENEHSEGSTNHSPSFKQSPVPNENTAIDISLQLYVQYDDPATDISLQLYIPMIATLVLATSTAKLTQVSATMTLQTTSGVLNSKSLFLLHNEDSSKIMNPSLLLSFY
jgi:hypothetical protein